MPQKAWCAQNASNPLKIELAFFRNLSTRQKNCEGIAITM